MTGSSERPEVDDLIARVLAARDRLRGLPPGLLDRAGPPDPETGETWNGRNVLGHVAEMLPFWTSQLRGALRGRPFGRDEAGRRHRQRAVDSGPGRSEHDLRLSVDRGCGRLVAFLERLEDGDLKRTITHRDRGPQPLAAALEQVLVGHLEAHLDQLEEL